MYIQNLKKIKRLLKEVYESDKRSRDYSSSEEVEKKWDKLTELNYLIMESSNLYSCIIKVIDTRNLFKDNMQKVKEHLLKTYDPDMVEIMLQEEEEYFDHLNTL